MGNSKSVHPRRFLQQFNNGPRDEEVPMLAPQQDRVQSIHSRLDIDDSPPPKPGSFIDSIKQRFTCVYIVLGIVLLVALAVLVVSIMLLCSMRKMDQRYRNMTSGSERFMRLYEDVSTLKGTHRNPTPLNDIARSLTPEQLAQARAFGLLPKEQTAAKDLGEPIKPVSVAGGNQQDVPHSMSIDELPEQIKAEANDFYTHAWHDSSCSVQCNKADITIPPLLVISLDGFSSEYLERNLVPSLRKFAECGARADFMFPSFPSKTFPNHYTIATGLYPESHGIVDNYVYDPAISPEMEDVRKTKNSGYFKGEPIWSQAVRQKRRMYCLMWPGCSFNVTGYNPTKDVPYDKSLRYSARVDMIIEWLLLPVEERPNMIMAYFDQPDTVGHFHKTDAEVNVELSYLESVLNYMFTSLKRHNLLDCVNIVFVSDHGMQDITNRIYLDELKLNTSGMVISNGVVGRIYLEKSNHSTSSVLDQLQCTNKDKFHVYDRTRVPTRMHYAKSGRIGDVMIEGLPGSIIFENKKADYRVTADHGYDYLDKRMHAIFFARGPNIRPGTFVEPFQNIELFNLFSELLRLNNDVPNNGTNGLLSEILDNISPFRPVEPDNLRPIQECSPIAPLQKRHLKACSDSNECQAEAQSANAKLDGCPLQFAPNGLLYTDQPRYCFINLCSVFATVDLETAYGVPTLVFETLTREDFTNKHAQRKEPACYLNDLRFEPTCDNWTATIEQKHDPTLEWRSILANEKNELTHYNRLQFLLYKGFAAGPFAYLQNITMHYARKHSRILSITGAAYDFDMDGIADDQGVFWNHISTLPADRPNEERVPSHIVRVLIHCDDDAWHINGVNCRRSSATRVLAFILPNSNADLNCLSPANYLRVNTARVRDVELLTNVEFFHERMWYPETDALRWRLNITEELWPL